MFGFVKPGCQRLDVCSPTEIRIHLQPLVFVILGGNAIGSARRLSSQLPATRFFINILLEMKQPEINLFSPQPWPVNCQRGSGNQN
jgi:hypothetical protein